MALTDKLIAIGDAVRAKNGTTEKMTLDEMAEAIQNIQTGVEDESIIYSYEQMNPTVQAFLSEAKSVYTETNYGTVSVVSKYNDGTKNYDDPVGKDIDLLSTTGTLTFTYEDDEFYNWDVNNVKEQYTVYNLIPKTICDYKVESTDVTPPITKSGKLIALGDIRQIYAPSADNCRDLGGRKSKFGPRVQYGVLYRGGDIRGEQDFVTIMNNTCKIKHEIDLQEENSTNKSGISMFGGSASYERISMNGDLSYKDHIDLSKDNYEIVVKALKKAMVYAIRREPTYIHCSLGRDRTGVICYLLEGILGMTVVDCGIDYELTNITGYLWNNVSIAQHVNGRRMFYSFHEYLKTLDLDFTKALDKWCEAAGIPEELIDKYRRAMLAGDFDSDYALDEPVPPTTYTNILASATNASGEIFGTNGYMNGKYVSSIDGDGASDGSSFWASGYMPISNGKPIYIKGWTWNTDSHSRFYHYNDSNKIIWNNPISCTGASSTAIGSDTGFTVEVLDEKTKYVKLTPSTKAINDINTSKATKWRISMPGTGDNVIITIDEPIE